MSPLAASIIAAAHPLVAVDPEAPLTDLAPLRTIAGDASIVGVARGAHGSRELTQLTHRLLRFLVDQLGFRTLAIEASWTTGLEIDAWLQTGHGTVTSRLRDANSWWRTSESADASSGQVRRELSVSTQSHIATRPDRQLAWCWSLGPNPRRGSGSSTARR